MDSNPGNPDAYNVEDLFDDTPFNAPVALNGDTIIANEIAHIANDDLAVSPAQTQHLVDVVARGSLNTLAWGKSGIVAQVVEGGSAVEVTGQRFDVQSQKWTMIQPMKLEATFEDVVGLAWNIPGMELAVFERKSGVHIFNMLNVVLNRYIHSYHMLVDPPDESHDPVGMLWLNLAKKNPPEKTKTILENVKENDRWRHEHVEGYRHPPHMLKALCVLDRSGMFSLLYTRDASPYKVVSLQVPVPASSMPCTHATFAQTPEGSLLLAIHDSIGQISTFIVGIGDEDIPNLTVEDIDCHIPGAPPVFSPELEMSVDIFTTPILTHLYFLAELEYSWDHLLNKPHLGTKQPPTLLALYVLRERPTNADPTNFFRMSIAKRWQVQRTDFSLHSKFGGGAISDEGARRTLQPLQDVALPSAISELQLIDPGNTLALTALDGTVMFYDPQTIKPIVSASDNRIVSNIGQVKLQYIRTPSITTWSFSSHALAGASLDEKNKLSISNPILAGLPEDSSQKHELDPTDATDDALIASYILGFSRSCWNAATYDDILSSIHNTITPSSMVHIRRQLFITLFQPKIFVPGPTSVSELDKVPHLMIVFKALAFHFGLFRVDVPGPKHERYAYLWAWTVLNLRWCIMVVGDTYKTMHIQKVQPGATHLPASELPSSFLEFVNHNIRWLFSLYAFIFSTLLNVGDRVTNPDFFLPASESGLLGDEAGDGSQGFVALLLTCNWSRATLLIGARLLNACATKAHLSVNFSNGRNTVGGIPGHLAGTTLGRVASTIQACCARYGITTRALEMFLDSRFHPDEWQFNQDNTTDDAANRAILERQVEMIVTGRVHETYQGVVRKIVDECLNGPEGLRARGEIDRLRLSEEVPSRGELFLNIDDIAFQHHQVTVSVDGHLSSLQMTDGDGLHFDDLPLTKKPGVKASSKTKLPARVLYDVHKKLPLYSHHSLLMNKNDATDRLGVAERQRATTKEALKATLARRCVRCGSLSDSMLEGSNKRWPRYVVILMNKCVCDGSWIVEEVGSSLQNI